MSENKIDKLFKDSLSNHEMPYDNAAWAALDKKMSTTTTGGNTWKWIAGGAAIVATAITVVYLNNDQKSTPAKNEIAVEQTTDKTGLPSQDEQVQVASDYTSPTKQNTSSVSSVNAGSDTPIQQKNPLSNNSHTPNENEQLNRSGFNPNVITNGPQFEDEPAKRKIKLPTVQDFCENQEVSFHNINGEELVLITPNGERKSMKPFQNFNFKAEETGIYTIAHLEDGKIAESTQFNVKSAPKVDIYFDTDIKYTNGVPTTAFSTSTKGSDYQWNFGKVNANSNDQQAVAHFFNKGLHSVSLTVTGNNGCKATETAKVNIEDNYNLLAVDAFNPNSTIEANQTFMPEALKDRNTPFKLLIIDANTGTTIYETNDISQPWDGMDRRNGQMALPGKTFLWKVILEKPLPGEASNYAGTVIVTSNR